MNLFNKINVKIITPDNALKIFKINRKDLVFELKLKIQKSLGYNINYQILKYNNITLENNTLYIFYNVLTSVHLQYDYEQEKIDNDELILKHDEIQNSINAARLNFMYKAYTDYEPLDNQNIEKEEEKEKEKEKEKEVDKVEKVDTVEKEIKEIEEKVYSIFNNYIIEPINLFMKFTFEGQTDICTCTMNTECVICKSKHNKK